MNGYHDKTFLASAMKSRDIKQDAPFYSMVLR